MLNQYWPSVAYTTLSRRSMTFNRRRVQQAIVCQYVHLHSRWAILGHQQNRSHDTHTHVTSIDSAEACCRHAAIWRCRCRRIGELPSVLQVTPCCSSSRLSTSCVNKGCGCNTTTNFYCLAAANSADSWVQKVCLYRRQIMRQPNSVPVPEI